MGNNMITFLEAKVEEEAEFSLFSGSSVVYLLEGSEELGRVIFDPHIAEVPTVKIHWLFIERSYRGKGFGKTLLEYFIKKYNDVTVLLDVLESNTLALNLYTSLGFSSYGRDGQFIQMKLENN
jgi:ribosomal protein S18 acetylase RimI-like enzyme